jgi:hypothetical protein
MLEAQVIGSCRVSYEEGRVRELTAVGPEHPRPLWTLFVDHDHAIADLQKDSHVYADERKQHCARVIPHVALSIARAVGYGCADGLEPLARIVLRYRRKAALLREKEFDLFNQRRARDGRTLSAMRSATSAV